MYNFTTETEHDHGVFEWNSYLERLQIADHAAIHVLPLQRVPLLPAPYGTFADGQVGRFFNADIRFTAEMKPVSIFVTLGGALSRPSLFFLPLDSCHTTFAKLLNRSSTDEEHASEVLAFERQLQEAIRLTRHMDTKEALLERLRLKEAN